MRNKLETKQVLPKKILLIVNESCRATLNKNYQSEILLPIYSKKDHPDFIYEGTFNFFLCYGGWWVERVVEKQPLRFDLRVVPKHLFKGCIPHRLKALNYLLMQFMLHLVSCMTDLIGILRQVFERTYFFENLTNGGECKSFSRRCDVKLIPAVEEILKKNQKSFVYLDDFKHSCSLWWLSFLW